MHSNHPISRRAVLLVVALLAVFVAPPATLATGDSPIGYAYRVELTEDGVNVMARFTLRESKDFAFLAMLGGNDVTGLTVRDREGERTAVPTGEPGVYRVDGLSAGTIRAAYSLPVDAVCGSGSCRNDSSAIILGSHVVLYPMGVDPDVMTPASIEFIMPRTWSLVTAEGPVEPQLILPSLSSLGSRMFLPGDQIHTRLPGGERVVVQTPGWQIGAEAVGGLIGAALHEQERLLGQIIDGTRPLIRVTPDGARRSAAFAAVQPGLFQLTLDGRSERQALAYQLVGPLTSLFERRLATGLAGAEGPSLRWWRIGFTRYTATIAAVRAGTLSEDQFIAEIFDAWRQASSDAAPPVSLAEAGRAEGDEANDYLSASGFLTCFLLDVRLRSTTSGRATLGTLLAHTHGRSVDNLFLQDEIARLAGRDAANLFRICVLESAPPPLPEEAARAGLELVDAGTGEPFTGFALDEDEPVIRRVFASGPARSMGLRAGDRITALAGSPVATTAQIEQRLAALAPGDPVDISVESDDGQYYSATLNLWEKTESVLRRAADAAGAAQGAWKELTRGEATIFSN